MEWLKINYLMYREAFTRAATLAVNNWPVLLSVFAYSAIMTMTGIAVAPLGWLGGMLATVVWAACAGSSLYLVEMMVRTSKVTLADFQKSFTVYLSDVLGVMFCFWVISMFVGPLVVQSGHVMALSIFVSIATFVLFNAVPELIYLGHHTSVALLVESYRFIGANWIEWFPANLAASALVYGVLAIPASGLAAIAQMGVVSLLVYFTMVMRGLLFLELSSTTYRARVFKYRARS